MHDLTWADQPGIVRCRNCDARFKLSGSPRLGELQAREMAEREHAAREVAKEQRRREKVAR